MCQKADVSMDAAVLGAIYGLQVKKPELSQGEYASICLVPAKDANFALNLACMSETLASICFG